MGMNAATLIIPQNAIRGILFFDYNNRCGGKTRRSVQSEQSIGALFGTQHTNVLREKYKTCKQIINK